MTKKYLWGHEFTLVKDGLDEEEVDSFVKELSANGNSLLEQSNRLISLKSLSEQMEKLVSDALESVTEFQEEATRDAEQGRDRILEEARQKADTIVSEAEESALSIKQQAEEAATEYTQEAEKRVADLKAEAEAARNAISDAKEEAEDLIAEAEEKARKIESEAKEHVAHIYEESTEEAETLIESAFERVRQVMAIKSDTLTQSLDSDLSDPDPMETLELANPDDGEGLQLPATPGDSIQPMQPEQSADAVLVDAQHDSEEQGAPDVIVPEAQANNGSLQSLDSTLLPDNQEALYEGQVQFHLPIDTDLLDIWSVKETLESTEGIEILKQRTSGDTIVIEVHAEFPTPLQKILSDLSCVSEVADIGAGEDASERSSGEPLDGQPDVGSTVRKVRLTMSQGSGQ